MFVKTLKLEVKSNSNTQIPVEVPAYEQELLAAIHGESNLYPSEEQGGFVEIQPENELKRLAAKYGDAVVTEIFGSRESQFIKSLEDFEVTPPSEGDEVAAPVNRGGRPRKSAE